MIYERHCSKLWRRARSATAIPYNRGMSLWVTIFCYPDIFWPRAPLQRLEVLRIFFCCWSPYALWWCKMCAIDRRIIRHWFMQLHFENSSSGLVTYIGLISQFRFCSLFNLLLNFLLEIDLSIQYILKTKLNCLAKRKYKKQYILQNNVDLGKSLLDSTSKAQSIIVEKELLFLQHASFC